MEAYLLRVKLPRRTDTVIKRIKEIILNECMERQLECIINSLDGRIILFSTSEILDFIKKIKGLRGIYRVRIFDDYQALVENILERVRGKESFAIESNSHTLAERIGADVVNSLHLKVNLSNPDIKIRVEKKGSYYLLYEENIYVKG